MIPYIYGIWKPSEGRGHRFESCRVRHFSIMMTVAYQFAATRGLVLEWRMEAGVDRIDPLSDKNENTLCPCPRGGRDSSRA